MSESQDRSEWIGSALVSYERPLTLYALRLVGDLDRARDVVQDTFLKLWEAERGRIEGHLSQWLYTVCRNRALDTLRKDGRMTALSESQTATCGANEVAGGSRLPREFASVLALMESLPQRQQEVLRLKFQGGLSYKQIGEVMGLTVSHVGVLIHTAVKTIRGHLEAGAGPADAAAPGDTSTTSLSR